jgi:branched-chain amino acid transport system permease protein
MATAVVERVRRNPRLVLVALVAIAAVVWPFLLSTTTHFYGVLSISYALVALSLTVLSGWTGQISLCQAAFLGIGVYSGQKLLHGGVPLPLTLLIVAAVGAAVSLVLGVPSLRLRGVYLTIATLAFGAACQRYFFQLESIRGYRSSLVPRSSFFGFSTHSDRDLYFVGLVVAALAFAAVANLRRSDAGRTLFAIRDSEDAAQALGVRLAPYKVGAFAFSAALATTAGVFYGMLFQATPGPEQFGVIQSFFLLALPVIGGLGTLAGAVVGGVLLATAQPVVNAFGIRLFLASGVLLVLVTLVRADGIVGLLLRAGRRFREQVRPDSIVRYGSFVPDAPAPDGHHAPRVLVSRPLVPGSIVRLRLSRSGAKS